MEHNGKTHFIKCSKTPEPKQTTVNPNTLCSQFQANISRMAGRINTGTSVLSS